MIIFSLLFKFLKKSFWPIMKLGIWSLYWNLQPRMSDSHLWRINFRRLESVLLKLISFEFQLINLDVSLTWCHWEFCVCCRHYAWVVPEITSWYHLFWFFCRSFVEATEKAWPVLPIDNQQGSKVHRGLFCIWYCGFVSRGVCVSLAP